MDRKDGHRARGLIIADVNEAARLIRLVAEPAQKRETTKSRIARAADSLGWSRARARAIWHAEARRIDAHEMDRLRSVIASFPTGKASENSDSG